MAHFTVRQQSLRTTSILGLSTLLMAFPFYQVGADAPGRMLEHARENHQEKTAQLAKADDSDSPRHNKKRSPASYSSSLQKLAVLNPLGLLENGGYMSSPKISHFWSSGEFRATETLASDSISPTFKESPAEKSVLIYAPPMIGVLRFPTSPYTSSSR